MWAQCGKSPLRCDLLPLNQTLIVILTLILTIILTLIRIGGKILLEFGADPNKPDPRGRSPLLLALKLGFHHPLAPPAGLVKALIKHGANPLQADIHQESPILVATRHGNTALVDALRRAAPAGASLPGGLLAAAVSSGNEELVSIFKPHEAAEHETLYWAAYYGQVRMYKPKLNPNPNLIKLLDTYR